MLNIIETEHSYEGIRGILYTPGDTDRGIIFAHGLAGNRYAFNKVARHLAGLGFACFAFDLPAHFLNNQEFSLSNISQDILKVIIGMKKQGVSKLAVVGHSLGCTGALFASYGYNPEIESQIYSHWRAIEEDISNMNRFFVRFDAKKKEEMLLNLNSSIEKIKQLLKNTIDLNFDAFRDVRCYVLLSALKTFPTKNILTKVKVQHAELILKYVFNKMMHEPGVPIVMRENVHEDLRHNGKLLHNLIKSETPSSVQWIYFQANAAKFVRYLVSMKEPLDYVKLIEMLARIENEQLSGQKETIEVPFFSQYLNAIRSKPKLFIYGKRDKALLAYLPFIRSGLESYYQSCGNAKIVVEDLTHILSNDPKEHDGLVVAKDTDVSAKISTFILNCMD